MEPKIEIIAVIENDPENSLFGNKIINNSTKQQQQTETESPSLPIEPSGKRKKDSDSPQNFELSESLNDGEQDDYEEDEGDEENEEGEEEDYEQDNSEGDEEDEDFDYDEIKQRIDYLVKSFSGSKLVKLAEIVAFLEWRYDLDLLRDFLKENNQIVKVFTDVYNIGLPMADTSFQKLKPAEAITQANRGKPFYANISKIKKNLLSKENDETRSPVNLEIRSPVQKNDENISKKQNPQPIGHTHNCIEIKEKEIPKKEPVYGNTNPYQSNPVESKIEKIIVQTEQKPVDPTPKTSAVEIEPIDIISNTSSKSSSNFDDDNENESSEIEKLFQFIRFKNCTIQTINIYKK